MTSQLKHKSDRWKLKQKFKLFGIFMFNTKNQKFLIQTRPTKNNEKFHPKMNQENAIKSTKILKFLLVKKQDMRMYIVSADH